ncbi:hypothetical protein NPIL_514011 [Nephila pilipes]|uniref:Uncharacterized protein n=1 Tax=Nephila pilipes TaxID=299642 RepID=A0A8X6TQT9_NEPPI|nr:hypothetical protein NPIL_514011 [Nephila pilipes]
MHYLRDCRLCCSNAWCDRIGSLSCAGHILGNELEHQNISSNACKRSRWIVACCKRGVVVTNHAQRSSQLESPAGPRVPSSREHVECVCEE